MRKRGRSSAGLQGPPGVRARIEGEGALPPVLPLMRVERKERPYSLGDFFEVKVLGQGSYGRVSQVINDRTETMQAMKVVTKRPNIEPLVRNEIATLEHLRSNCAQYFLCFVTSFEDEQNWYIVFEFLESFQTLEEYIQRVYAAGAVHPSCLDMTRISCNLINGLQHMHANGVAHRDIKPENIMVNPATQAIKYIDFGFSCVRQSCRYDNEMGTVDFEAPEVLLSPPGSMHSVKFIQQADLWALGMTLFELLTGQRYWENKMGEYARAHPEELIENARAFITNEIREHAAEVRWDLLNYIPSETLQDCSLLVQSMVDMTDPDANKRGIPYALLEQCRTLFPP